MKQNRTSDGEIVLTAQEIADFVQDKLQLWEDLEKRHEENESYNLERHMRSMAYAARVILSAIYGE